MKINIVVAAIIGLILFGLNNKFLSNTDKRENETPYYKNLSIDYIVISPGYTQKKELEALPFIKEVTPYYYTQQTFLHNGESFKIGLYIIEKDADINNTPFSQKLLIDGALPNENEIIIDQSTAQSAKASLGDNAEVFIGNVKMSMRISGVVQANKFSNESYNALIYCTEEVKKALGQFKDLSYQGAYIKASDVIQAGEYLKKSYKAKGEIGDPSWYESYAEYESTKKKIENADFSKEITDVSYLKADAVSNNAEKTDHNRKNIVYALISGLTVYFAAWLFVVITKENEYSKRINNGTKINTIIKEFVAGQFLCCAITCILTFVVLYGKFPQNVMYVIFANVLSFLIVRKITILMVNKIDIKIKSDNQKKRK